MGRLTTGGLCLVAAVELCAIFLLDRRFLLWASGVAVVLVLLAVRRLAADGHHTSPAEPSSNDPGLSLRRWLAQTETLLRWSESSRADWDRHLRPRLAREFEMVTGQRQAKNPAALQATGRMLFGEELWRWVDPGNVARTGGGEPGPGRAALDEILQRLERV